MRTRGFAAVGVAFTLAALLTGCSLLADDSASASGQKSTTASPDPRVTATPEETATSAPATPSVAPNPTESHLATPEPVTTPVVQPTLTPVPAGTVVAQGDVASPKGSIHFHYQAVANGNNTYSVRYSGFTSTIPVPVSVTLIDIPPRVGDGLTWHGVGDHVLGGPTTKATASTASLGNLGQPSYLTTLVTYSSAPTSDGIPVELGPNKVLAVNTVHWSIPVRATNVHPVDHGARSYAAGKVTATTSTRAPRSYLVAQGDITSVVAERFGISVTDLIWLNANLQVFGDQQYLYAGTTLNLDPDRL
ncbi:hypothetical protein GCM10022286_09130 [Gryllotalpicola daejeonensis]|uniref:LysM domain-containing protein n=1 Tax=Gryllotalpicola daejeonensis TaxID=993087 RepID=A0ABP7ZHT6_9MICO